MQAHPISWIRELAAFPARFLTELPEGAKFRLQLYDFDEFLTITTWEFADPTSEPDAALLLDGLELRALVAGVEAGRFLSDDLVDLCERKRRAPATRLELADALAGAVQDPDAVPLSLEDVLRRLGGTIVSVQLRELNRAPELSEAA